MPNKPQPRVAVGYWGRDVRSRVKGEMTLEKTRALFQDQLMGGGLRAQLWQAVFDPRNGTTVPVVPQNTQLCSCVKQTGQQSDRRCLSCHGITYVPGYKKFGYETIWFASISPSLTLINIQQNTITKPYRLELTPTSVLGTIVTPDLQFINTNTQSVWEYRNDYVIADGANSSIQVEFSTNGGLIWNGISQLPALNPQTGRIRFRITIMRTSINTKSPAWEILRARFSTIPVQGRLGPWIVVLKTVPSNRNIQDLRGIQLEAQPNNFWTSPLSYFDLAIQDQGSVGGVLDPRSLIIDPAFVQFIDGTPALLHNQRWSCTNLSYSDPFGYLTRQFFQARIQQENEFTGLVF